MLPPEVTSTEFLFVVTAHGRLIILLEIKITYISIKHRDGEGVFSLTNMLQFQGEMPSGESRSVDLFI